MITVQLKERVGSFAENKDIARDIRVNILIPALEKGEEITLDFKGIDSATQSFVHALISDLMRKFGVDVIEKISFKSCNEVVQKIVTIVIDYMQESSN
jgi:hypothetical protein